MRNCYICVVQNQPCLFVACRGMYRDFLQCMRDRPSETQAFDLLSDYERVCQEQVLYMYKLVNRAASRSEPK